MEVVIRITPDPENPEDNKRLLEIEEELTKYVLRHFSKRLLAICWRGFKEDVYYMIFNFKEVRDECSAEYFVDAMKFSQDLFYRLKEKHLEFPRGWEVRVV